jgi:hypothetical protein
VTVIDPSMVPVQNLVQSFLTAMMGKGAKAFVVFLQGTQMGVATNHPDAEATARNALSIKDGALEMAAVALHAFRFTQQGDELDKVMDRCSLHPCAIYENEQQKSVPWDELPEEVKQAHRVVANAVVGTAIAHTPPKPLVKV